MSGESDLNREFGESKSQSYHELTTHSMGRLKAEAGMGYVIGFVLMLSPLIALKLLSVEANPGIAPMLIVSFVLFMAGFWIFASKGIRLSLLVRAYAILQRLGTPGPQIIGHNAVREYRGVYIIGVSWAGFLYFIAFREEAVLTSASKLSIPRNLNMWFSNVEVSGMKLVRREGVFSVPTEHGDFVSGEAVVYGVKYMSSEGFLRTPEFTREQLLAIIERISEDAKNPNHD